MCWHRFVPQKFTADELQRMEVSYAQLVKFGMTVQTERMFKFSPDEWGLLGR